MIMRISLAELIAMGVRLRPTEAVTIVGELCRQTAARVIPGLPSPEAIRLSSTGDITIEGRVPSNADEVRRAAQLLEALLPEVDAPPEYRASGALRLVIARGLGTLDLPPYPSLESFCAELMRFTTVDARDTVAALVTAFNAMAPQEQAGDPADAVGPMDAAVSRRTAIAVWIGAPAAAAVLGYLIALPLTRPGTPRGVPSVSAPTVAAPAPVASTGASPPASLPAETAPEAPRVLEASAYSPAFGASGAVYFHQQEAGASALKRAENAGTGRLTVTTILEDRAQNFHVRPSPDGSLIAYDSDRDGIRAVFVARADGSGARRISGSGYAAVPSWSPDGRQIAFVRAEPDRPKVWNLWVANADGAGLRRLTRHAVGQPWGGSWFPDGRRIAYSVESRLVILDLVSGRAFALQSPRPGLLVRTPAVSPDGRRIVFQVRHDGAWLADVATGRMTRVLDDPTAEEYAWAPDGHHVAYHSRRTGTWSVWVMTL
jgi:hypothetical protein